MPKDVDSDKLRTEFYNMKGIGDFYKCNFREMIEVTS